MTSKKEKKELVYDAMCHIDIGEVQNELNYLMGLIDGAFPDGERTCRTATAMSALSILDSTLDYLKAVGLK